MNRHHITVGIAFLCWMSTGAAQMTFTTVARGVQSGIEERRTVVVRTAKEWSALWKEHAADEKAPAVDLTNAMIVAVFSGSRPSAGHGVEITRIEKRDRTLVVTYRETQPRPDEMTAQVMTFPFHVVRTEAHAGPVRFERAR